MKNNQITGATFKDFLVSRNGKHLLVGVLCIVIWGIIFSLWMGGSQEASMFAIVLCAFFGWRKLSRIQPVTFVFFSGMAIFVYIFVKGILSAVIGMFVAPWVIASWLGERLHNATRNAMKR